MYASAKLNFQSSSAQSNGGKFVNGSSSSPAADCISTSRTIDNSTNFITLPDRPRGQVGIYIDIVDSKPADDNTRYASKLLFDADLAESLFSEIESFPKDVLKGLFERLGLLNGVIFDKTRPGVVQLISFDHVKAIDSLVAAQISNSLSPVFQQVFSTPDILQKLGVKHMVLRARLWDDEIRQCREEFKDGVKLTADDTARVSEMVQKVKAYQKGQPATFTKAKDALHEFALCLGEFIQAVKVNSPASCQCVRTYAQLKVMATTFPKAAQRPITIYGQLRDVFKKAIIGLEEGVCHRLAQVNSSYLSASQQEYRRQIQEHLKAASNKLEADYDFSTAKHPTWQPRVLLLEQEKLLGLVCLPQLVYDDIYEADRYTDELLATL